MKTLLIVEDDNDQRQLLWRMFHGSGQYKVLTARDGQDALRIIREEGMPDVILADYNMPKLNGVQLLQEVRRHDPDRRVKAILATATHMRTGDDARRGLEVSDLMMAKPFDYKQLMTIVAQLSGTAPPTPDE